MAFAQCPYNSGHRMPANTLEKHMRKCPDAPLNPQPAVSGKKRVPPHDSAGASRPASKCARTASAHEDTLQKPANSRTSSTTLSHLTESTFDGLGLHPKLQRSIDELFQYRQMTKVQEAAIPICMTGGDVVAKAKTGTGKTLGFLLPSLHNVLSSEACSGVQVLVLSPTRELAMQTAEEAQTLLKFTPQHMVMTMLGGTNMNTETNKFKRHTPLVIVATPGRLNDHLENSGLATDVSQLSVLVFDEADQLLDMGFRPAIEKILRFLPAKDLRQTLLFSATFPAQLQSICQTAVRKGHEVVDCIGLEEEASNQQVEQRYHVCTFDCLFATTLAVLSDLVKEPHKIIVFLPTARETQLFAGFLSCSPGLSGTTILEIHSRKNQNQRTKISEQFRTMSQGILCSSDVSARGMDYPDVTFVLQVGAPSDKAQYLHRLGRTARAGKQGSGMLLLCDWENYFLNHLKDLPLVDDPALWKTSLRRFNSQVDQSLRKLHAQDAQIGAQAYQAWLGEHNGKLKKLKWSSQQLVEMANWFATGIMKLPNVPALEAKTVGKMGLKGTPGLVIGGKGW